MKTKEKFEGLVGKRVSLYMKPNPLTGKQFNFEGDVKDFDGKFLELFDIKRNKLRMVSVSEITEIEIEE